MKKINFKILLGYITLFVVAIGSSVAGIYVVKKVQNEQKIAIQPSQYPDYLAIKGDARDQNLIRLNITDGCPDSGCINPKSALVDFDGIHKKYIAQGQFSRAYLYIEAMVDYNRPLTSWDDIYFKINGIGGHLISDNNSLPVPPSELSKYLYDLRSISYFPSIGDKAQKVNEQKNIDFFYFFQNNTKLKIDTSLSSGRPGRVIKDVSVYYECLEGSICSITEVK